VISVTLGSRIGVKPAPRELAMEYLGLVFLKDILDGGHKMG
jgi:hypothetical protein